MFLLMLKDFYLLKLKIEKIRPLHYDVIFTMATSIFNHLLSISLIIVNLMMIQVVHSGVMSDGSQKPPELPKGQFK